MKFKFVFICIGLILTSSVNAADRPNVLFIAVDDLNDWVGVLGGHPQAKTPNIDAFAETGAVVFKNAHCAGPVCGPSRSALLSGFMPHRTGLYGNAQNMLDSPLVQTHATLPEYFSKNGYHSLSRGKIFHRHATVNGSDPGHWAFDEYVQTKGGGGVDRSKVTSRNKNLINGRPGPETPHSKGGGSEFAWGPTRDKKENTKDYLTAKWAADELMKPRAKPFFMAVGLSKPHLPFYAPQEFFDLYPKEAFIAPEILESDLEDISRPDGRRKFTPSGDYLWLKQNGLLAEAARAYMATVSYADACLGVIFDGLEKSPHAANTIVILWGDHGWHLGEKLRFRKATGWHESTRVPLIVRTAKHTKFSYSKRLVNLIDLYPTLIDLCGLPEKNELDGVSFAPLLADPDREWRNRTLTVFGFENASIHDERWHYMRHHDGTEELYDLKIDPLEWTNLIQKMSPESRAARTRLASFVPGQFAPVVQTPKSAAAHKKSAKGLDKTIKPRRPLDALK